LVQKILKDQRYKSMARLIIILFLFQTVAGLRLFPECGNLNKKRIFFEELTLDFSLKMNFKLTDVILNFYFANSLLS
jgi:hypothetical protein